MSLEELRKQVLTCTNCELAKTRNKVIFGEGNQHAPILVIGEAPGHDEDLQGRPFVGRSGQLLDKILGACGFDRKDHVFISNIVKCRPPGNRVPHPDETFACKPYLIKQIELIDPKIIILLGATSLKSMMKENLKISQVRGRWMKLGDRLVMPVYHPSALLRNPALKKDTWEDFKKIVHQYRELIDPGHYSKYV